MRTFGGQINPQKVADCPRLEELGIRLYVELRKGQLYLQIRQDTPKRWRLKSLVIGQLGQGDIVYEPNPPS